MTPLITRPGDDQRLALEHYADQYCEGWCGKDASQANFEDCGGCLARKALASLSVPDAEREKEIQSYGVSSTDNAKSASGVISEADTRRIVGTGGSPSGTDHPALQVGGSNPSHPAIFSEAHPPQGGGAREAELIEREAKRRCELAEMPLDYLACQDRRFRHDDRRLWWIAMFVPKIESQIETLRKAGFHVAAPVRAAAEPGEMRAALEAAKNFIGQTSEYKRGDVGASSIIKQCIAALSASANEGEL